MSFASDATALANHEVTVLQVSHAQRMAKKYLRLERLNDPIIHRYTIYDYLRLQGVSTILAELTLKKADHSHVSK